MPSKTSKKTHAHEAQPDVDPNYRTLRDGVQEFKRSVILQAATDLFFEKGYQNTTVDEVAAAMSVSKAVVYSNFRSKLALLEAVVDSGGRRLMDCMKFIQPDRTPVANLAEFCFRQSAVYLTHHKEIAVHLFERRNLSDDLRAKIRGRQKVVVDALIGILADGVRTGDFRPMDCELVAYDIISLMTMSFDWRWHHQGQRHSSQSLSRHFAEQALRMAGHVGPFPFGDDDLRTTGGPPPAGHA